MVGVVRWTFTVVATGETVTLPYNPNAMTSPFLQQATTRSPISPIDGLVRATRTKAAAKEWTFGGFIRSKAHHDLLRYWAAKKGLIDVTDHFGRSFRVRFVACDVDEKKPTKAKPWRLNYTMRTLTYGETP